MAKKSVLKKKPRKASSARAPRLRVQISLEPALLSALDTFIAENGRSLSHADAITDLLADELINLGILPRPKEEH